jgi:cytochrome d ubiquinol oxidase subunit II
MTVQLYDIPMYLVLIGLVMYAVLAGADYGAGVWQLFAGRDEKGERIREHGHRSMAPVWEANHVWLIFVLVVLWTAYPVAFGSIGSTLSVALFIGAIGIILRGFAYALRSGAESPREIGAIDTLFSVSSVITPFALGAAIGGIASRRVPVGNAAGDLISSWLNPTSILIGAIAVVTGAYLAAVYLAADAERLGESDLAEAFRTRALFSGLVAGAIAIGGLAVLRSDARALYDGLTGAGALPAVVVSAMAGVTTLLLVFQRHYEPARFSAAVAVAAIVAGWALAQKPLILPGLTIQQAAAPHDTLVAILVAVAAGGVIVFPSLALLFRLVLTGGFDRPRPAPPPAVTGRDVLAVSAPGLLLRTAIACLIGVVGFLNVADAAWAHAVGVLLIAAFLALGFVAVVSNDLAGG